MFYLFGKDWVIMMFVLVSVSFDVMIILVVVGIVYSLGK